MVPSARKRISIRTLLNSNNTNQLIYSDVVENSLDDYEADDSFHNAMKRVATFVQFLFLMPVCGISNDDPKLLNFKWSSFRVIITLFYITYGFFTSFLFFRFINQLGIDTKNIGENFDVSCAFPGKSNRGLLPFNLLIN